MKIAVINEVSACGRNADILSALEDTGHEIYNLGMKNPEEKPELLYTHTGFMTGLLLHLQRVDFVVGGCGTGQGYMNSCMQYPGVFCGHILSPLDGWLYTQINGGNCVSLALNQGYGWAGNINLKFIFERMFSVERGSGYPKSRREPQGKARSTLCAVSRGSHREWADIVRALPQEVVTTSLSSIPFRDFLDLENITDQALRKALLETR